MVTYISRSSRYRLMSGSESITIPISAASTTALISLVSIPCTSLRVVFPVSQDVLDRADRVRKRRLHRLGQSHARADVCGPAGNEQAPPGASRERGEPGEDAVGGQAVGVDDRRARVGGGSLRLYLQYGDRAWLVPPRRGVDQDEQVAAIEQVIDQVHAADAEVADLHTGRIRAFTKQLDHLDPEGVIAQEHVAHAGHQGASRHGSTSSGAK